jgi:hypothetical protein
VPAVAESPSAAEIRADMSPFSWQAILGEHAARFVLIAAFPRLAAWVRRWPTRLRPRGVVLYIAMNTAIGFALRAWLVPYLMDKHDQLEQAKAVLRGQLGREPTAEELMEYARRERAGET